VEGRIREGATLMTMSSRVLTTLGVVLCALGVTVAAAAAAAPVTAGTTAQPHPQQSQPPVEGEVDIDPSDLPGDGTESNPYEISNVSELQAMEDDLDANYELVSDIDASQTAQFNDGRGFDPVGGTLPFTGSFEGNDHTITGLTINRPDESNVGLFGSSEGTVPNVTLTGVTVTGDRNVGGLVGDNGGAIQTATASGNVTGRLSVGGLVGRNSDRTIRNAFASGSVTGESEVGGLVGDNGPRGRIQSATASGSVSGEDDVGGLVGVNGPRGRIQNATASGTATGAGRFPTRVGGLVGINNGTIQTARASGSVTGESEVGGLVGINNGTIQTARASGGVSAETFVGGLVGININGTIQTARASGSVTGGFGVGGLVGGNGGTVQTARASGSVSGETVGGLVGSNVAGPDGSGTIQDAFAVGPVSGSVTAGGLVGENIGAVRVNERLARQTSGKIEQSYFDTQATGQSTATGSAIGLTTAEMQGQAAAENMTGLDFQSTWTSTNGYPALRALPETDQGSDSDGGTDHTQVDLSPDDLPGEGTDSDPYEISNVSELQAMEDDLDGSYELVSDIDASDTAQFNDGRGFDPIGEAGFPFSVASFRGSLDGNGHTITHLTIERPGEDNVGLFRSIEGSVTDIAVSDVRIIGGNVTGSIVGFNLGSVQRSSATGVVTGHTRVGGLAGDNNGELNGGVIQQSYTNVTVHGVKTVGGIAGRSGNGGTIASVYAVGPVNGSSSVGGLTGGGFGTAAVTHSYFDTQATGQTTSAKSAIKLTTAQMQGQAAAENMDGFDFENTWTTTSEYPALRALSGADEGSGSGRDGGSIEVDVDPSDLSGDGSESDPYEISNVSELQAMEDDLDANYELVSDIDASQTAQLNDGAEFDPIGSENTPFIGSLDGNSRTVTALTINRSTEENVGLFGVCVGTLTEVTLTNAAVTGNEAVGRLVGSVSGDSLLQEIRVSGKVSGDKDVGGIVGVATGSSTLRNVTASGEVKSTQDQNVGGARRIQ